MEPIFLEIVFDLRDLLACGFEGREEIEEQLEAVLTESRLGEVTGGGSGMGKAVIDVEMGLKVQFQDALLFLRKTLQRLRVPHTTVIKCNVPREEVFGVY